MRTAADVREMLEKDCPLCDMEQRTEWAYEDQRVIIARCESHPDTWMCVLKRHTPRPTRGEKTYMRAKVKQHVGDIPLRGPNSIPEHFHLHEV